MKTRKYKQRGGSIDPYTAEEIIQLQGVGFTDDQIEYLNDIKINYGLESLNAVGIVYIIGENTTTPTLFTASYEDNYPFFGDTDNEEETDDDEETPTQGGKKRTRRKRQSVRRRKSIKRRKSMRKKIRKSRRRRR
jgi:hypothetical protein